MIEVDHMPDWAESQRLYDTELQEKKDKFKEQLRPLLDVDSVGSLGARRKCIYRGY